MARLQNAGRVSATNVDRSRSFADDRECLLRIVPGRSGENSKRDIRSLQLIDAVLQLPVGLRNPHPSRQPSPTEIFAWCASAMRSTKRLRLCVLFSQESQNLGPVSPVQADRT
jgi:hypothetical protein